MVYLPRFPSAFGALAAPGLPDAASGLARVALAVAASSLREQTSVKSFFKSLREIFPSSSR